MLDISPTWAAAVQNTTREKSKMRDIIIINGLKYDFRPKLLMQYMANHRQNQRIIITKILLVLQLNRKYLLQQEGKMILNVFPSEDINILGAVEVERGMYDVELPLEEVERVWEERMPYLDFKYPEGLPTVADLDVSDLKDTTKRFR